MRVAGSRNDRASGKDYRLLPQTNLIRHPWSYVTAMSYVLLPLADLLHCSSCRSYLFNNIFLHLSLTVNNGLIPWIVVLAWSLQHCEQFRGASIQISKKALCATVQACNFSPKKRRESPYMFNKNLPYYARVIICEGNYQICDGEREVRVEW